MCTKKVRFYKNLYSKCGKCPSCKRQKIITMGNRINHELRTCNYTGSFITLTYNNKNIKKGGKKIHQNDLGGTLKKEEAITFIKNIRNAIYRFDKNIKIKYVLAGEYGTINYRPHYHLLIIGMNSKKWTELGLKKYYGCNWTYFITNTWKKGNIDNKETITDGAGFYILGYVSKKSLHTFGGIKFENREQEFVTYSKGIGKDWIYKNEDNVLRDKGIAERGKILPINRYYFEQLVKKNSKKILRYKTLSYKYENNKLSHQIRYNYIVVPNFDNAKTRELFRIKNSSIIKSLNETIKKETKNNPSIVDWLIKNKKDTIEFIKFHQKNKINLFIDNDYQKLKSETKIIYNINAENLPFTEKETIIFNTYNDFIKKANSKMILIGYNKKTTYTKNGVIIRKKQKNLNEKPVYNQGIPQQIQNQAIRKEKDIINFALSGKHHKDYIDEFIN